MADHAEDIERGEALVRVANNATALSRVETKLDRLVEIIGSENDDGKSGQGLLGRVARIDAKTDAHEKYLQRVFGGFAVVGTVAAGVLLFFKTLFTAAVTSVLAAAPAPHP